MKKQIFLLLALFFVLFFILSFVSAEYSTLKVVNGNIVETRILLNGNHFLSILTSNGNFAIRPHPGLDVNGWGGTLYLQPFLPGAVLKYTTIQSITVYADRVEVVASGFVSKGSNEKYGTWSTKLSFNYNPSNKRINGWGNYNIALAGKLSAATGDLNLFKIADNYLMDVPLLSGIKGDTGDMKRVDIKIDNTNLVWNPASSPGYFPSNAGRFISMNVIGQQNIVDSVSQGYAFIQPAYKPTIMVSLNSTKTDNIPMIFGGIYNTAEAKQFWSDNIGVTPLILKTSSFLNYNFNVKFSSSAIAGDGLEKVCDGKTDFAIYDNIVGKWYILNKNFNVIAWDKAFGGNGMWAFAGDYDGDKKSDLAVWNPTNGKWYVYSIAKNVNLVWDLAWGSKGMVPVSGDYDGDGRYDLALWNPTDGKWWVINAAGNKVIVNGVAFGAKGMTPISGDYDGDGKYDLGLWNPTDGKWYVRDAANTKNIVWAVAWGSNGMKPVSGDYDGDKKSDLALWNPTDGKWYVRDAANTKNIVYGKVWGFSGSLPVSGDYDGDGRSDLALWNPSDTKWYVLSSNGNVIVSNRRQGKIGMFVPGDYCTA